MKGKPDLCNVRGNEPGDCVAQRAEPCPVYRHAVPVRETELYTRCAFRLNLSAGDTEFPDRFCRQSRSSARVCEVELRRMLAGARCAAQPLAGSAKAVA